MGGKHYNFIRPNKLSFVAAHEDRNDVRATLHVSEFAWHLRTVVKHGKDTYWKDREFSTIVPAYDCDALISEIVKCAFMGWESPKKTAPEIASWFGAKQWSLAQVKKAIAKRVASHWRQALESAYPQWFLDIHRRIFSVTYRIPEQSISLELLDKSNHDPYLVSDIMNYRAAAHAILLASVYERHEGELGLFVMVGRDGAIPIKDVLNDWQVVYDVDLVLNRSKRRTIMNLPAHLSTSMLQHFRHLHLDRPMYTKQEITWACALASKFAPISTSHTMENKAILHPTQPDLHNAIRRYAMMVDEPMSVNKTYSYNQLAEYLADAIHSNVGWTGDWIGSARTVTALFKTAEKVHRAINQRNANWFNELHDIDSDAETAVPDMPLPVQDGITFLATAQDVADEGALMKHCISGYAGRAVSGGLYIFHIEHKGKMATAAINVNGLVQCHGPRNKSNAAVKYGKRVLSGWAKQLALNNGLAKMGKAMTHAADAAVYLGQNLPPIEIEMQGAIDEEQIQNLALIVGDIGDNV